MTFSFFIPEPLLWITGTIAVIAFLVLGMKIIYPGN